MTTPFRIELLNKEHNRAGFSCGVDVLNVYLREQARQDMQRRAASCYVAVDACTSAIAGYYTISASGIPLTDLPETLIKKLPRYPSVPVALLGRLAVDVGFQGKKIGAALLGNAVQRALASDIAVAALVVNAKDEQARSFYHHYDFLDFGSLPNQLILHFSAYRNAYV